MGDAYALAQIAFVMGLATCVNGIICLPLSVFQFRKRFSRWAWPGALVALALSLLFVPAYWCAFGNPKYDWGDLELNWYLLILPDGVLMASVIVSRYVHRRQD